MNILIPLYTVIVVELAVLVSAAIVVIRDHHKEKK